MRRMRRSGSLGAMFIAAALSVLTYGQESTVVQAASAGPAQEGPAPCAPDSSSEVPKGFTGTVTPAATNTATIQALTFRVLPCRMPDGSTTRGRTIDVRVNEDGSFASDQLLPPILSSVDTSPYCQQVESLELGILGEEIVSLVSEGTVTSIGAAELASTTIESNAGWQLPNWLGGFNSGDTVSSTYNYSGGGINLGCANSQRSGGTQ